MPGSQWYAIKINGRLAALVVGRKDALIEMRRIAAQNPNDSVTMENER